MLEKPFDLSILIVNYNTAHLFEEFFSTLYAGIDTNLKVQIIVVDNASTDNSVDLLRLYSGIILIENKVNVGFGRANNQALEHAHGKYVLLLNTDAFIESDTITKTITFMDNNPNCGVLGVKLISRDGALQPSCRYFPTPWNLFLKHTGFQSFFKSTQMMDDMNWDHASVRACDWVPGCYYLVRQEVIAQVGLFDPIYFLYSEEVDHCKRVKNADWDIIFYPDTSVIHIGGESAKSEIESVGKQVAVLQIESEIIYYRKNHGLLGLWQFLILSFLSELVLLLKSSIKNTVKTQILVSYKRISLQWRYCFKTKFGLISTR